MSLPRRRNGKQQSCEPCRKRKLACDHVLPTCTRCLKRGAMQDCVYLPSPMTKRKQTPSVSIPKILQDGTRDYEAPIVPEPTESPQPRVLFNQSTRYLGPTSFSAVFEESRNSLESTNILEENTSLRDSSTMITSDQSSSRESYTPDDMALAISILSEIPSQRHSKTLFSRHVNPHDGWNRLAAHKLADSLWISFNPQLMKRNTANLQIIAKHLFRNIYSKIFEGPDPAKWVQSFSGYDLKWEALGILFTYWSFGAISSPEEDEVIRIQYPRFKNRREYMVRLKECAGKCISLCNPKNATTLLVYLMYKHSLLESIITGDASLTLCRLHAETVATAMAMGMHRQSETSEFPSIHEHANQSIIASLYNVDKILACFTGRPPLLSRRYMFTPLPLDVSDEALMAGGEVLKNATNSLDKDGWNTDGQVYSTTILRVRYMFTTVRDGILELALGRGFDDAATVARHLKSENLTINDRIPAIMAYNKNDAFNEAIQGPILYARTLVRLEFLQNMFLIERLLLKYGQGNMQELIEISRDMLDITLNCWKHRDRFFGMISDFEWIFMSYAVPAGGVLCMELLKHAKSPQTTQLGSLPRSETIQNLSFLNAILDWVKPSAPNADLCHKVRDIIGKALDFILNPQAAAASQGYVFSDTDVVQQPSQSSWEDLLNFEVPDTFDWIDWQ